MTKKDQRRIITEMITGLRKRMIENLPNVPDTWDGIELRQWLTDVANEVYVMRPMDRRRMQAYRNNKLTRNL